MKIGIFRIAFFLATPILISACSRTIEVPTRLSCNVGANYPSVWENSNVHFDFDQKPSVMIIVHKNRMFLGDATNTNGIRILKVKTVLESSTGQMMSANGSMQLKVLSKNGDKKFEVELIRTNSESSASQKETLSCISLS